MKNRRDILWGVVALAALVWCCGSGMARAQAAAFHPLDLSTVYTTSFVEALPDAQRFPTGSNTFNGVPFQVGGRIDLAGIDAARNGAFAPTEVTRIPVNRKAHRLHLLHGALHGQREGIPLANIVLRFKNGDTRAVRLAFGLHARNCFENGEASAAPLIDPNSRVAWESATRGRAARMFETAVDVPLPEEEIVSLDYVSLFSRATPVLFAVTLQLDAGAPLAPLATNRIVTRATEFPDAAYRRELPVRVTDAATSAVLSNAAAVLSLGDDAKTFFFGQFRSDSAGRFTVIYPPQEAASLSLRVNHRGHAAETVTWSALDGKKWPETLEVRLQRGTAIGGTVTDPGGAPVSNAVVIPYEITQRSANEFHRHDLDLATTDGTGKWQASVPTQLLARLSFEATHPDYQSVHVKIQESELLASTAQTALKPYPQIAGRVLNRNGTPIARASVTLVASDDSRATRSTDADGRFKFVMPESMDATAAVFASALDYAPAFQSINRTTSPLEFRLDVGSTFTMRLTDGQRPVPDVNVSLYRWENRLSLLRWSTKTDAEGRFRWDHAPDGQVMFRFEKAGQPSQFHSVRLPQTQETSFVYAAPTRIVGTVIDAITKKPVDQIRVRAQYSRANGSGSSSTTGRKGSFTLTLSSQNARDYTTFTLTLDAPGYETLVESLPPGAGSITNTYELKKVKLLEGVVRAPDGSLAPDTEILMLELGRSAYMDEPGKFRRSSYYEVAVADEKGKFELTPRTNANLVLASHPKLGFADVDSADFRKAGTITLKPWGHVKGTLRVGDKLEADQYAAIHTHHVPDPDDTRRVAPLYIYYRTHPAPDGSFSFDAVPPGERMVQLRYMSNEKETGYRLSHNTSVTVKAGETNEVLIGGTGRTVTGQVRIVGAPGVVIDGRRGRFQLTLQQGPMPSEIPPPLIIPPNSTAQERQQLIKAHREKVMEANRNRIRATRFLQKTYLLLFDNNNNFTVPNVPPGRYMLDVSPYDPRLPSSTSRNLGNVTREVIVPEGTTPFDAGTIDLQARN
jgi:hypothetical protein